MTRLIMILMATLISFVKCDDGTSPKKERCWHIEGKTMGTYYRVLVANSPVNALTGLDQAIKQQLAEDNRQISTWQNDTVLSRFNHYHGTEPQSITPEMANIISTALYIGAKTDGAMDITIGPLVNLWGFGPEKKLIKIPDNKQIEIASACVGLTHLRLIRASNGQWLKKSLPNMYIDLSTVGEGYVADHLATLLEHRGIIHYLVSLGGAVLARGFSSNHQPWRVAIQHPTDKSMEAEAIVDLQGRGISTSGSYSNYYEFEGRCINHIINPITGRPIDHKLVSATVIATSALEADSWDTGLMVLDTEKAKQLALREGLAVFLITKTNHGFSTWMSPQFSSFIVSYKKNNS